MQCHIKYGVISKLHESSLLREIQSSIRMIFLVIMSFAAILHNPTRALIRLWWVNWLKQKDDGEKKRGGRRKEEGLDQKRVVI